MSQSQGTVVGIVTRPWAEQSRMHILVGARNFIPECLNWFWGPPSLRLMGARVFPDSDVAGV